MADKKKQTIATDQIIEQLQKIRVEVNDLRNENKVLIEQLNFRLEEILINRGNGKTPKKPQENKEPKRNIKKKSKEGKIPTNTFYWWKEMFIAQDPISKKYYTDNDVKIAEESLPDLKDEPDSPGRRGKIAAKMWELMPIQKRQGELKTAYNIWKNDKKKNQTENVERENNSDEDSGKKEKKPCDEENENDDDE